MHLGNTVVSILNDINKLQSLSKEGILLAREISAGFTSLQNLKLDNDAIVDEEAAKLYRFTAHSTLSWWGKARSWLGWDKTSETGLQLSALHKFIRLNTQIPRATVLGKSHLRALQQLTSADEKLTQILLPLMNLHDQLSAIYRRGHSIKDEDEAMSQWPMLMRLAEEINDLHSGLTLRGWHTEARDEIETKVKQARYRCGVLGGGTACYEQAFT